MGASPKPDYRGMYTSGLGERLTGSQEVSGSIPLFSTNFRERKKMRPLKMLDFQVFSMAFSCACKMAQKW